MKYPANCKTTSDKKEYLFRTIELLRLEHNKQSTQTGRNKCMAATKSMLRQLEPMKDYGVDKEVRLEQKNAAKVLSKWDSHIKVGELTK